MNATAIPLRLTWDRALIYGAILALIASLPFIIFPSWFHDVAFRGDFANFWSAGANVGTTTLLDPAALSAWQVVHHITPQVFVYPPGVAWFYAPVAHLPPIVGLTIEEISMGVVLGASGVLAARIYKFSPWFGLLAVFAWAPALNAIEVGQNTPIALLAVLIAIWALVNRRTAVAGLAVGVLLYKPSAAFAFIVLLLVRKEWRALAVCAICGIVWYVLSVSAARGSLTWPVQYVHLVERSSIGEFAGNSHKAFTLPTLFLAAGAPLTVALATAVAIFGLTVPLLARRPALEASSMAGAVGLAAGLHAWPYEATLLLPAAFYGATTAREPGRTRVIIVAYVIAVLALSMPYGGHGLALLPVGAVAWWLWSEYRKQLSSAKIQQAPSGHSL